MKEEIRKAYHRGIKIKNSHSSFIGSSLLIVATLLPCLDRFISWFWPGVDILTDNRGVVYSINIWIASVYLAPVFIIIAAFFKPHRNTYYFPLTMFAYSAIVYYAPIFGFDIKFLRLNSWLAALISLAAVVPIMAMLRHVKFLALAENSESQFYDDVSEKFHQLNNENIKLKKEINNLKNNEDSRISDIGKNA